MCKPSNSDDRCLVCLEPFKHNLKGLLLGLLDGFVLVLSNNSKACDFECQLIAFAVLYESNSPCGTPG